MFCYITCCNFGLKLLSLAVHFHKNLLISELFWREKRARIQSPPVCLFTYLPTFLQLFQTAEYHIHLNALHCFCKHLPVPAICIWNWACAELHYRPSKHVVFLSVPVEVGSPLFLVNKSANPLSVVMVSLTTQPLGGRIMSESK